MASLTPRTAPPVQLRPSARFRTALHLVLHFTGFLATILVLTWGLFALFFLMLGGLSLDGMMSQLHNFSSRYVVASPERVASFKQIFAGAHLVVSALLIVLRRHQMFPAALGKGSTDNG